MRYFVLLILIFPLAASAEKLLVAECEVGLSDDYFDPATRFIIVFDVDKSEETIWFARNDEFEVYGREGPEEPFEVNGGVWSIILAGDVRRSLRRLSFRFVESEASPPFDGLAEDPSECAFDYAGLREYKSR